jgi:hypothetical protein
MKSKDDQIYKLKNELRATMNKMKSIEDKLGDAEAEMLDIKHAKGNIHLNFR